MIETTTIDKLFLELSQVTKARTKRDSDFFHSMRFVLGTLNESLAESDPVEARIKVQLAKAKAEQILTEYPH